MSTPEHLRDLLTARLTGSGLLLERVSITPAGRRRVVKVVLDRMVEETGDVAEPVPALTLDEIADATRLVSDALDGDDALGEEPYTLEVTSPGVGRPLTEPAHYRRTVGRLLTVHPRDGEPVTGRVLRAGTADLTLEVPASKKTPARREDLAYAALDRAEVQVEFSRPDPMES